MNKSLSLISILLVLAGMSFAATGLGRCQEISTAGQYYLTSDVSGGYVLAIPYAGVACFKITTDNVELDCRGNDLIGPVTEDSYGVLVPSDLANITVTNCTFTDFGYGLFTWGSSSDYSYLTATNNMVNGLHFYRVTDSTVYGTSSNFNHNNGVQFIESDFNIVTNMNVNSNTNNGIYVLNSNDNTFTNVVSDDNLHSGVEILYGSGNDITNAILDNNAFFGIYMLGGGESLMTNVDATNNDIYGAYLAGDTSDVEFNDLDASLNLGDGLNCNDCHNVDISNSFFNENDGDGMSFLGASGIDIIHSEANDNKLGWGVIAEELDLNPGALGMGNSKVHRNAAGGIQVINSSYINLTDLQINENTGTGFAALGTDIGHIYVSRNELQNNADGAALEGASFVDIEDVNITFSTYNGLTLTDVSDVQLTRVDSNNNGRDGFNIVDFSDVDMYQVNADDNGDDGIFAASVERLSSGLRINSAKDDAAGMALNGLNGLHIINVTNLEMIAMDASNNGGDGIRLDDATNYLMRYVVANDNDGNGFSIGLDDQLDHSGSVEDSEASGNLLAGILANKMYACNLTNVTAEENGLGVDIGDSDTVNMEDLYINLNAGTGLELDSVSNFLLKGVVTEYNGDDGIKTTSSSEIIFRDSRLSSAYNGDDGIEILNSSYVSIINYSIHDNLGAGLELSSSTDMSVSESLIYGNLYGILFDTSTTQGETTQTNVNNENNTIADEYVELVTDTDGDGVPDDEDDCESTYGTEAYKGCPAAIYCKITSNDVLVTGIPGQQPVEDALCKAYKRSDSCVVTRHPDSTLIVEECVASSSCVTDAQGLCLMGVEEALYYVAAIEPQHPGKYPGHDIGLVDNSSSPKMARLAFLRGPDGKTSPGKSSKKSGSELWIYEPQYVVWEGTEEYYPFVFESGQNWSVDVCLEPPEGYVPSDNEECLQQVIAGQPKAILFKLVEVGSVPDDVKVKMKITNPHGKKSIVHSKVGIRLSQNLAKAKGVAIDKNGVITGKAAKTGGVPVNPLFVVLLIGAGLTVFVADSFLRTQ